MQVLTRRGRALGLLLGVIALAAPLQAASPRDELLRLVPDSVGFCLVVQDMRQHAAVLRDSPFVAQLSRSPLAERLRASDDLKKIEQLQAHLKNKLGMDLEQLRDDILGDAFVFAYRPGPPGKPEQEQGVMLLRARNARVLADLVERVNKVQKEEGELKELEERQHNGAVYYRRLEYDKRQKRDKPPNFYYVRGPVLALSSQEEMLRATLDCERTRPADAVPELTRRLRELDADRVFLALWFNPRSLDAEIEAKAAGQPDGRASTVKHFAQYWKALDSVAVSLSPGERDVSLSLGVRARVAELPPAAQRLLGEASATSDVWRRFPESALLAVGGRSDGAALLDVLGGFLGAEGRRTMNADLNRQIGALLGEDDFVGRVLPGLGPDWGLCVTAPAAGDKGWLPQSLFALRVDPAGANKSLGRKMIAALDFAARLAVLAHNSQHPDQTMALKTAEVGTHEVHYLTSERGLPPGVRPAYALLDGYLVLASSPDGIARFARPPASSPAADAPTPLMRVSVKDWRSYLDAHREPVVQFLADKNQIGRDAAARQLDGLLAGLQFLDRIELRQRCAPGQALLTLSVQTAQPLRK